MKKNLQKKAGVLLALVAMLPITSSFATSISISVSDSISTSITTISNSISNSTKAAVNAVKLEGGYKITDVAADDISADRMRIALRADGDDRSRDIYLHMPVQDYRHSTIGVGQIVQAVPKSYGVAFFQEYAQQPFAVALADNLKNDLKPKAVS